MKSLRHASFGALALALATALVPLAAARTAEDSLYFRNLSNEAAGAATLDDQFPQLAVSGNTVHLAWLAISDDTLTQRLLYRRSSDGGRTFEPVRVLLDGSGTDLNTGFIAHDSETGQTPAFLAVDGNDVHLVYLKSNGGNPLSIHHLRSTDGGVHFDAPQVLASVDPNPPAPGPGKAHISSLGPPLIAAAGGRVVVSFRHTQARAVDTPFFGWQYGYYSQLTIAYSSNHGESFTPATLSGDLPTIGAATPTQLTIQGSEVLVAARDNQSSGFGSLQSAVHAGISTDGGANFSFSRIRARIETAYGDAVRIVKSNSNVLVFFASEDNSEPTNGTLFLSRSIDGGLTFQPPVRLTDDPVFLLNNSSFTVASHGGEIFVAAVDISQSGAGRLLVRRSTDTGATFSPWSTLADGADMRTILLTPAKWPRFSVIPGDPGAARVGLLWTGAFLAHSADSAGSFGPPLLVRPPGEVLPHPSKVAPQWLAGPDGSLHLATSSASLTNPTETDIFYRRFGVETAPTVPGQALTMDHASPSSGDTVNPRHRDSLQITSSPALGMSGSFTIEFWARFRGNDRDGEVFSSQALSIYAGIPYTSSERRFRFALSTKNGSYELSGSTLEPKPDTWYHLALRYDPTLPSNQMALLINGQVEAQGNASGAWDREQGPLYFGNSWDNFRGEIDDIRFWNTGLSTETIRSRYRSQLKGNEPGLAAWFPLDGHTRDVTGHLPDGMLSCRESFVTGVAFPTCIPVPSGLVGWWQGEGNFLDRKGGNNATGIGGAGFAAGMVGQAFDLNGSTAFAQVAVPVGLPLGNSPRTVMLWCKTPRNLATSTDTALIEYGSPATGQMFGLITSSNAPGQLYFYGHSNDLATTKLLTPDTWHHVAATYDGTTVRLYLDGQPDGSAAHTLNTTLNADGLTIGNRPGFPTWQGQLDEVMIFNRALDAAEIAAVHAAGEAGVCTAVQPVAPQVTLVRNGAQLQMSWLSQTGLRYRIQSSATLAEGSWIDEDTFTGTGGLLSANLPIGPDPRKFFRLRVSE